MYVNTFSNFTKSSARLAMLVSASIILAACGDSNNSSTITPPPTVQTSSGYVADSAVTGASCNVYAIANGVAGTTSLGSGSSQAGAVDFGAVNLTGPAIIQCTGGTFTDEATGQTLNAPSMSSVVNFAPGGTYVVSILTEIAASLALAQGDLGTALSSFNTAVADSFGLDGIDITAQIPTDINTTNADDNAAGHYGSALLLFSQMVADRALGTNRDEVIKLMIADMADDGKMSPTTLTAIDQAMANFVAGSAAAKAHMNSAVTTQVVNSSGAGARPVANAGSDQSAIAAGTTVTLSGSATDSDGTIAAYAWKQTSGTSVSLTNANAATATFTAPSASADSTLVFALTATDSSGNIHTDSVTVSVKAAVVTPTPNVAPTASAGADQSVAAGAAVTVNGSGTDTDGTIAAYKWTEVSSSGVTLTGATTQKLTFTAPSAATASVLEFKLTVTDDDGASASDNVKINVAATAVVVLKDQAALVFGANVTKTVGQTHQAQATGGTTNGTITYSSSDTNVATVAANGTVTAKVVGQSTITATMAGNAAYKPVSATYVITVVPALAISSIASTNGTLTQDSAVTLDSNASTVLGSAVSGKTFTITGTGFGATAGTVTFRDTAAAMAAITATQTSWADTSIVVTAPPVVLANAGSQENYTVTVTTSGSATATYAFKYDDCDTCRLNDGCPF